MSIYRLEDLYRRGTVVEIEGPTPDGKSVKVPVWLAKADPLDHDTMVRRANGKQASVLAERKSEDSEWQSIQSDVLMMSQEELIQKSVMQERAIRQPIVGHRIALDEERDWAKDGYLEGLKEVWFNELQPLSVTDPTDPEVVRVKKELDRYDQECSDALEMEVGAKQHDLEYMPLEKLRFDEAEARLKYKSLLAWRKEFNDQMLYHCTRTHDEAGPEDHPEHEQRYFTGMEGIRRLDANVKVQLVNAYEQLNMDVIEGKSLRAQPASLPLSEPAVPEETNNSSGRPTVAA